MGFIPPGTVDLLRRALAEDLAAAGDITTDAVVPAGVRMQATLMTREQGTVAGLEASLRVFTLLDTDVTITTRVDEGAAVQAGTALASLEGPAAALLAGERTSLNLLCHLSGIATATTAAVAAVEGTGATVADTRKTTPGLRALEKMAVRLGGGRNHRFGLYDAVLIKDNHLALVGTVGAAVRRARDRVGHMVKIEVEVETLDALQEALDAGVDAVLLDNMSPPLLREAVRLVDGRCVTESSGSITLDTIRAVARTGVDVVSLGWITHSAPALDIALDAG
ncbi:putative nicotinate-nucleotide pyrophosphorylase [carboxylating] [bacterium BMS3Bbin01]|nr:putative nicotinate-nucleotide pyrophosphorylase [carboxylating] [bacterium BMS3Bbin01]